MAVKSILRTLSSCFCCNNDSQEIEDSEGNEVCQNLIVHNDSHCCSNVNHSGLLDGDSNVRENERERNLLVQDSLHYTKEDSVEPKYTTEGEGKFSGRDHLQCGMEDSTEPKSIAAASEGPESYSSNIDLRVTVTTTSEANSELSRKRFSSGVHPFIENGARDVLLRSSNEIKEKSINMMKENLGKVHILMKRELEEEMTLISLKGKEPFEAIQYPAYGVEKSDISSSSTIGAIMVKCTAKTESNYHGIGDKRFSEEKKSEDGKNVDQDLVKSFEEDQSYPMSNTVEMFHNVNMDREERNDNFCDDCTLEFMQELGIQPSVRIQNFKRQIGSKVLWYHALSITLPTFHVKFTNVLNFYQIDCLIMFDCVCGCSDMLSISWSLCLLQEMNEVTSQMKYYTLGKVALNLMMNGKLLDNAEYRSVVDLGETLSRMNMSDLVFVLSTVNTEKNSSLKKLKIPKYLFKSDKNILKCVIGSLNGQLDTFYTVCPVSGRQGDRPKGTRPNQRQRRPQNGSSVDVIDYIPPVRQQLSVEQSVERSQLVNQEGRDHGQPLHPDAQTVESDVEIIGNSENGTGLPVGDQSPQQSTTRNPTTSRCDRTHSENRVAPSYTSTGIPNRNAQTDGGEPLCQDGNNVLPYPDVRASLSNPHNAGSPQNGSSVDVLDHIPTMPQQLSGIIEQSEERSQLVNQGSTGYSQLLHPDAQVVESNLQNVGNSENCTGLPVGDQSQQQSITRNPTTSRCDRTQQIQPLSENRAAPSYTSSGIPNRNAQTDGGRQLCQDGNNVLPYPDVRASLPNPPNAGVKWSCFPSQGHHPIVCREYSLCMFNVCGVLCVVGPLSSWLSSPENQRLFERYAVVLSRHRQLYQDILEMSRHFNADPPNFGLAVALWIKHVSEHVINHNAVRSRTGLRNVDLSNSQLESAPLHLSAAAYSCCLDVQCLSFCTEGTMMELPCIVLGAPEGDGEGVSFQDLVDDFFLGYDGQTRRCSFCKRESILTLHPMPPVVIFNPRAVLQYISTSTDIPEFISIYGYRYRRLVVSFWRDRHLTAVAWIEQLKRNMYYDCNDYRRDQPELGILHEYTEDPVGATIQMIVYVLCPDP